MAIEIRPFTAADWPVVQEIYVEGILTGHATFEHAPPSWVSFDHSRLPDHRLVAVGGDGVLVGWAAVMPTSSRPVYRGVVEHSIYVASAARGRGVGHVLLEGLITSTEAGGIWTIQSALFPENAASLALHAAHGFRAIGRRERIGRMTYGPLAGQWRDTILLERRSAVAGSA